MERRRKVCGGYT